MSILDDAIREHLELKRAHGAGDAELKKLEDEAFGPPARPEAPDPLAEAPTEFMAAEAAEEKAPSEDDAGGRRVPNVADLQEAPEPPPQEPEPAASHSTEERHAISEQPTELFDVEGEIDAAPDTRTSPSDDELVDAEMAEPRLAPVEPQAEEDEPEDEFDDYFSEQRLSDELSQALDAPLAGEPEIAEGEHEDEIAEPEDEHEAPESDEDEHQYEEEDEDDAEYEDDDEPPAASHDRDKSEQEHDDVLENTPDFLEDTEDDDLWFEQRPPKDFDFDD
jgi:hypothetical protein